MLEKIYLLATLILSISLLAVLFTVNRWNKENDQPRFKERIKSNIKEFKEFFK